MNISIKSKIYWSFSILVSLFVINAAITIFNVENIKKLSGHISGVIDPSMQSLGDFNRMMIEAKMYSTNWVFLHSDPEDKKYLQEIHDTDYEQIKRKLANISVQWKDKRLQDSLKAVFTSFGQALTSEKKIIALLTKYEVNKDDALKIEAERVLEEEVIPQTGVSAKALKNIIQQQYLVREAEESNLESSSKRLRIFIILLGITIIFTGIFFSLYMTKIIISPINKIRLLLNDLGKGILGRADHHAVSDEMGKMVVSVNQLSKKLEASANFAKEIGERNFNTAFQPLSDGDILGKALISMRDNLKSSDERMSEAQHIAKLGSWEWNMTTNELFWSDEMFNIFDVDKKVFVPSYEKFLNFVLAEDRAELNKAIADSLIDHSGFSYEYRCITDKFASKIIFVQGEVIVNANGGVDSVYGTSQDITSRKKSEASLEANNKELQRKNKELEQFAYVASHDLQEPLRTTSSFVELIRKQYYGKLDSHADKYLNYILHASDRMKVLITDLLDYSRIGKEKELEKADCNDIMSEVLCDITVAIEETGAMISLSELPVITCYPKEIKQLFQNLTINAIKFRKKYTIPEINISFEKDKDYWHFSFRDNGIGIDEQYKDRIFIIFQRLHSRSEYQGSGIGLSHCKKIVELHHGRIWVESTPGEGSTFHFTIRENNSIINQPTKHETKAQLYNAH